MTSSSPSLCRTPTTTYIRTAPLLPPPPAPNSAMTITEVIPAQRSLITSLLALDFTPLCPLTPSSYEHLPPNLRSLFKLTPVVTTTISPKDCSATIKLLATHLPLKNDSNNAPTSATDLSHLKRVARPFCHASPNKKKQKTPPTLTILLHTSSTLAALPPSTKLLLAPLLTNTTVTHVPAHPALTTAMLAHHNQAWPQQYHASATPEAAEHALLLSPKEKAGMERHLGGVGRGEAVIVDPRTDKVVSL